MNLPAGLRRVMQGASRAAGAVIRSGGRVRRLVTPRGRAATWLRRGLLLALAVAGAALFLRVMNGHYPIDKWLFWIYARAWLFALLFAAACLSSGHLVVSRILRPRPPLRELLLLSFAVGVVIFAGGLFVVGLFHGLGPVFFYAWPGSLVAVGATPLVRTLRRVRRLLPRARRVAQPPSWLGAVPLVFGFVGAALLYINILTPGNVAFDSRFYHMALAQHYAAAGAVTRFPEGWFCSTYPHLASLLYTWSLLVPGADMFNKIEMAAHLEYVVFLATLAGVAVLARWAAAAAGVRVRNGWAALFLFPGIMLYDSTLSLAADHVLALFGPPIFLMLRRVLRDWRAQPAVVFGVVMAGALLTKYQAVALILVPSLVVTVVAVRRAVGRRRLPVIRALGVPLVVAGAALVTSAPLWLKNWVWYGNPVYPLAHKLFPGSHPWEPGTDPDMLLQITGWTPQGPLKDRLLETLKATFTFSFSPHDWGNLHGSLPIFGSLFTLSLPLLLFLRHRRRLLGLALAAMAGVAIWYWTYHQDRYLQALLPWMAAVAVGTLALVWHHGWLGRLAVLALVAPQVVWGGDVYTIPTHAMIGTQPARVALDLFSSGYRKDWAIRSNAQSEYEGLEARLPKGSGVLIHERLTHFGHGRKSVIDMPGTQGGISYATLETPRAVYDLLHSFGTTHIMWLRGTTYGFQSSVADLVFFEFVEKYTVNQVNVGGFMMGEMPKVRPAAVSSPRRVHIEVCGASKTVLMQQLDDALRLKPLPEVGGADLPAFYVSQAACDKKPPEMAGAYRLLLNRGGYDLSVLK